MEGADHIAGQLRRDKEYPFSDVTKSGRVWRKVPESNAQSVTSTLSFLRHIPEYTACRISIAEYLKKIELGIFKLDL